MNAAEAYQALASRGYSAAQADLAVTRAGEPDGYALSRHRVTWTGPDSYVITPVAWAHDPAAQVLPGTGQAWPELSLGWDVGEILAALRIVDAYLDEAGPQWAKDCPEANMARRVGKAQLEAAEAMEELSLLTGENPRKGQHPEARERMLAELGDTAVAALLGIQSVAKDTDATWAVFLAALAKALARVREERPS